MRSYTSDYYRSRRDGARRSARTIVPMILELVQPRSVIDVGCGLGTWLSVFAEYGTTDIFGVDGRHVDGTMLEIPRDRFLTVDLEQPLRLERRFDLVMSLEVAEHLPGECAEAFVESLTGLGPVVLFSAAIPFQGGRNHVNEQWPDYWAERFQNNGYLVIDCLRKRIWQREDVQWWYAQNMLLFVRRDYLSGRSRLENEAERTNLAQLSIVHPRKYVELHEWWKKEYTDLYRWRPGEQPNS